MTATRDHLLQRIQEARSTLRDPSSNLTDTTRAALENYLVRASEAVEILYRGEGDDNAVILEGDFLLGDLYLQLGRAKSDQDARDAYALLFDIESTQFSAHRRRRIDSGAEEYLLDRDLAEIRKPSEAFKAWHNGTTPERALEIAQEQAAKAAAAALEAAASAQASASSAGRVGDIKLSGYFEKVASDEGSAAARWTGASIGTTLMGAAVGYLLHQFGGLESPGSLIYPAIVGLSIVGLAAYFARLGGHHRHTSLWAKSISVQLDSYEQFVHHTSEDARVVVFDRFAARVLGAPPPRSPRASNSAESAALLDIIASLSKQAS